MLRVRLLPLFIGLVPCSARLSFSNHSFILFYLLQELGSIISDKFNGDWKALILSAEKSAARLIEIVTSNISSFDDKCDLNGRTVYFRKRVQILVADIWACFEAKSFGEFHDIDVVTMFADYRVPQSLVYFGAIKYSDRLLEQLRHNPHLERGGREECEIRAASIWSVELVRRRALELFKERNITINAESPFNAIVIDFYLWDYAKAHSSKMDYIPIHKTLTIFY